MASLSLKHINKTYPNGFEAVKDFNLEIEDKEFIIFVGNKVVVIGGDNYRIGLGGGSVSSVDTGRYSSGIELNAVQIGRAHV